MWPLGVQKESWVRHGLGLLKAAQPVARQSVLEGHLAVEGAGCLPPGVGLLDPFFRLGLAAGRWEETFLWRSVGKRLAALAGTVKLLFGGVQLEGEVRGGLRLLLQLCVEDGHAVAPPLQLLQKLPLFIPQVGPEGGHQVLLVSQLLAQLQVVLLFLPQLYLHDLAFLFQFLVDHF